VLIARHGLWHHTWGEHRHLQRHDGDHDELVHHEPHRDRVPTDAKTGNVVVWGNGNDLPMLKLP
jgi:hypothetical protein